MEKSSSANFSQSPKRALGPDVTSAAFEARYTELMGTLQQVRAQNTQVRMQFQDLSLQHRVLIYQHQELRRQLAEKREVIRVLLPYYPHPLTPELRRKVES